MTQQESEEGLARLEGHARAAGATEIVERVRQLRTQLNFSQVHVVVVGEFNRGKSTFVNGLIGEPLVPMDIVPTTAAIWTIERGGRQEVAIVKRDGTEVAVPITPDSLGRLSAEGDLSGADIRYIRLRTPLLAVGDDVVVIDTPGVNDINEQRAEVTYGFLGRADAAVFLLDASSPVTKSEADFLKSQVLDASLDKILFVLNKTDRIDDDEVQDSLAAARERLAELVGRPMPVIAYDAGRVLGALQGGYADIAARWGWDDLCVELGRLLAGARDAEARCSLIGRRLKQLAIALAVRLESRAALARLDGRQLADARAEFETRIEAAQRKLDEFAHHFAVHGRDRLKAIVTKSLVEATDDFVAHHRVRLKTMKSDFRNYAQTVLPHELQVFVKRWFEGIQGQIEAFTREVNGRIAHDYERAFGGTFGHVNAVETVAPKGPVVTASVDIDEGGELLTMALPAAAYIGLSFLVTGPFAILGLVAGGFAAKKIKDAKAESLRDQLLADVPEMVTCATQEVLGRLHASVDDWYAALAAALEAQFRADLNERARSFEAVANRSADALSPEVAATAAAELRLLAA